MDSKIKTKCSFNEHVRVSCHDIYVFYDGHFSYNFVCDDNKRNFAKPVETKRQTTEIFKNPIRFIK